MFLAQSSSSSVVDHPSRVQPARGPRSQVVDLVARLAAPEILSTIPVGRPICSTDPCRLGSARDSRPAWPTRNDQRGCRRLGERLPEVVERARHRSRRSTSVCLRERFRPRSSTLSSHRLWDSSMKQMKVLREYSIRQ